MSQPMDDLMLPPLPKPAMRELDPYVEVDPTPLDWYTADQMREYARKAVEAEREAILAMSEAEWFESQFNYDEAIRARR